MRRNSMDQQFLYRALRSEEIEAGNILIPKGQGPFTAHPRLGIDTRLPFVLVATEEHAVRQHQWKQRGFPTSGVSTTPHIDRARFYAQTNQVIVKIDRSLLKHCGVREYDVSGLLASFPEDISIPEDDEVILVSDEDGLFPNEVIVDVIWLDHETLPGSTRRSQKQGGGSTATTG